MSFSEIRRKDVVNISDGRKLGRPIDLILNDSACVQALVVPGALRRSVRLHAAGQGGVRDRLEPGAAHRRRRDPGGGGRRALRGAMIQKL